MFSLAITGKPARKGHPGAAVPLAPHITSHQSAPANSYQVWLELLSGGRLWDLRSQTGELLILVPANNTDYNNVAAYLETFWATYRMAMCQGRVGGLRSRIVACRSLSFSLSLFSLSSLSLSLSISSLSLSSLSLYLYLLSLSRSLFFSLSLALSFSIKI